MKADHEKPLYADYRKQMTFGFDWRVPITSGGKYYWLADMPLVVTGRILIVLAIGVIGWLNPYSRYYSFETSLICLVLIIIATSFYKYKFTYRVGRFSAMWEDKELHPETPASSRCDKDGKFLKTEENHISARKSRRAFLVLFAGIIAAVLLYCFLWIGLSYTRVLSWHKGEIEEAWQIAQKYNHISGDHWGAVAAGKTESGEDISKEDRRRIWEICRSLQWEYVSRIRMSKDGYITIVIDTIFGHSKLVWNEDIRDAEQVKNGFLAKSAVQLGEHWFYLWEPPN